MLLEVGLFFSVLAELLVTGLLPLTDQRLIVNLKSYVENQAQKD